MNSLPTIKNALHRATGALVASESSELDAEVLLARALDKPRSHLRAWPEKILSKNESKHFNALIRQRQAGTPIAYIIGERQFWSRSFMVSPDVLIPRPDTELLIEIIQQKFTPKRAFTILDLGTGSGIIAITVALEFDNALITAVDSSKKALSLAQKNAQQLGANNITFASSDWFSALKGQQFDLIVSNPPYICSTDPHLRVGDVRFEPTCALIAEHAGLSDIEHIANASFEYLKANGTILFEHGYEQGEAVKNLLESSRFKLIEQFNDIQGHLRATLGKKA